MHLPEHAGIGPARMEAADSGLKGIGVAAALKEHPQSRYKCRAVVLTGGNADRALLLSALTETNGAGVPA